MANGHQVILQPASRLRRKITYGVVVVLILAAAGWGLFDFGRYRAGYDSEAAIQQVSMLELRIQTLNEDGRQLRERIAVLEHGQAIDKAAYVDVEGDLKGLQDEIRELKQQLTFYQNIVSPADTRTGVRVQTVSFQALGTPGEYRYQLILIQGPKRAKRALGRANVSLKGLKAGEELVLPLSDLQVGDALSGKYRFRYFQEFQSVVAIPDGFEPQEVLVKLVPDGKNPKVVEEQYAWKTVVN